MTSTAITTKPDPAALAQLAATLERMAERNATMRMAIQDVCMTLLEEVDAERKLIERVARMGSVALPEYRAERRLVRAS